MKRFFLTVLSAVLTIASMAEDYTFPYLVFTGNDGTQTAVAVDELEITFSNGQLVATSKAGAQTTLSLADLASMHFSKEADPTGIQSAELSTVNNQMSTFYDLSGRQALRKNDSTPVRKGVYIVRKSDGSTSKVMVR